MLLQLLRCSDHGNTIQHANGGDIIHTLISTVNTVAKLDTISNKTSLRAFLHATSCDSIDSMLDSCDRVG